MSCGGLRTLDVIVPLEGAIGVPVVSSTPHGLWHCARMLGVKNRIDGFGMVMAAATAAARRGLQRARDAPTLRERRRILVVGSGGAGKSTFARQLGELTGLPVVHLDRHFWRRRLEGDAHGRVERDRGAVGRRARVDHGRQLRRVAGHPGTALRRGRVLRLSSPDLSVGRPETLVPLPGPDAVPI